MIVKIAYEQLQGTNLAVYSDACYTNAYMILRVDKYNLEDAIKAAVNNKWIVGLEYMGLPFDIDINTDFKGINVYAVYQMPEMTEEAIGGLESTIPRLHPKLKVVINTAKDFCNMQIVKQLCEKYSNISFMGGSFLRLKGCNFGEVDNTNLPKKVSERSVMVTVEGDCSILPVLDGSLVEYKFGDEVFVAKRTKAYEARRKAEEEAKAKAKLQEEAEATSKVKAQVEPEVPAKGKAQAEQVEPEVKKSRNKKAKAEKVKTEKSKPKAKQSKKQVGASFAESEGLNCF